jgi:hypothetical protein
MMASVLATYVDYFKEFKEFCTEEVYLIKITSRFLELINAKYAERMILAIRHILRYKKLKFTYPNIPICRQEVEKDKKIIKKEDKKLSLEEMKREIRVEYDEVKKFIQSYSEYIRKSTQVAGLKRLQTMLELLSAEKQELHNLFDDLNDLFTQLTAVNLLRTALMFRKDFGESVEAICKSFDQQYGIKEVID